MNPYGYANPYQFQAGAWTPQLMPAQQLVRVTGIEGARAYQMGPNSAVALFDGDDDVFYVKTTDGAGFPTVRAFRFEPMESQATAPAPEYVTREEFERLREMVENAQQSVPTVAPAGAKRTARGGSGDG